MKKTIKFYLLFPILFFVLIPASAQKPKWVGNTPQEGNDTYKFVEIISTGASLTAARTNALSILAQDEQLGHAVEASVQTGILTQVDQKFVNGEMTENIDDKMNISVNLKGKDYKLQALKVDEYVAGKSYGEIQLHTLYMVAVCNNPRFDRTYLTNSYGATPIAMSVIPGLGQWYKGSKVKGISMFAAEAAAIAGIIICDNQKASYVKKAKEQPKFIKEYSSKADNWETGRNICIGVAAGIWVYNMVDAIVAKGARRVVVKRANGGGLSMSPFAMPDGRAGVSFAYNF